MADLWFTGLVWAWIAVGLGTLLLLFFVDAPYGKHQRSGWGPGIPNQLAWFVMEIVVLAVFFIVYGVTNSDWTSPTLVFAGLLSFHYVNRALIYPWRTRTRGKTMPLSIFAASVGFNTMNGFLLGWDFSHNLQRDVTWFADPRFLIGIVLFVAGLALNWDSDNRLLALRKGGDTGYHIPYGGGFSRVSAPNLLGEIIEWGGFALLTWSISGLAFFIWTCANLVPRALATHRWYHEKFPDYPANRKALIPYVW